MKQRLFWVFCVSLVGMGVVGGIFLWQQKRPDKTCSYTTPLLKKAESMQLYCFSSKSPQAGAEARANFGGGAVLFEVTDDATTVSVSQQQKPPQDKLAMFVPNVIPLYIEVETPIGKAFMGVRSNQTLISLPAKNSATWLLITAPQDYSPEQATKLLRNLVAN